MQLQASAEGSATVAANRCNSGCGCLQPVTTIARVHTSVQRRVQCYSCVHRVTLTVRLQEMTASFVV